MKKRYSVVAMVFVVMLASGIVSNLASAETVLRLGTDFAEKHWAGQAAGKFAEYVKEKTNGEYSIRLFPGAQLGSAKAMFAEAKLGSLDLILATNNSPCEWKEGRNFNATASPFRFRTNEEMAKFFMSPLAQEMYDQFAKGGIRLIGYFGNRSPRALTTSNLAVHKPDDMIGLKIRVPGMKSIQAFFKETGAKPTPIPYSDLFMALKTGIVAAQDNGVDNVLAAGFYEVQKYYIELNHAFGTYMMYASGINWNKWPDSLKKIMIDGCVIAAEHLNNLKDRDMKTAYQEIQDKGMIFIPSKDVDTPAFESIGRRVFDKFDGELWDKGFMDKIEKQLEQIRKAG